MLIRPYRKEDVSRMRSIWNAVVEKADSFPQDEIFSEEASISFFAGQSYCAVAQVDDLVCGLYILHPNNVGHVSHIANASYAVDEAYRGRGVGKALVEDSLLQLASHHFSILQFNAVVVSNTRAIRLYEQLGFTHLGTIKGGYAKVDGSFEDILSMVYYVNRR